MQCWEEGDGALDTGTEPADLEQRVPLPPGWGQSPCFLGSPACLASRCSSPCFWLHQPLLGPEGTPRLAAAQAHLYPRGSAARVGAGGRSMHGAGRGEERTWQSPSQLRRRQEHLCRQEAAPSPRPFNFPKIMAQALSICQAPEDRRPVFAGNSLCQSKLEFISQEADNPR